MTLTTTYLAFAFALASSVFATLPQLKFNVPRPVNLRIEGASSTIFEGVIWTRGHDVTTVSGGTHHCDGTNNGVNEKPGATATSALDDAAAKRGFEWDGTWSAGFDDFFITSIGDSPQTSTQFWGILVNYQFTEVGGCQQQVAKLSDKVLWAFDAFNAEAFLKLEVVGQPKKNKPFTVLVTNGATGLPVAGATVGGATTGADGKASLTLAHDTALKAEKAGTVRSNRVKVNV